MTYAAKIGGKLILVLLAAAVLGGMVMVLWNAVMPVVFADSRSIDYPHALGLLVLSRILFGGFRGHGGWGRSRRWSRWQSMTPEERDQFQNKLKTRGFKRDGAST